MTELTVRGLPLPRLLTDVLTDGRWRHPGDAALRNLVPWFEAPLAFLASPNQMDRESAALDMFADDELSSPLFRTVRGCDHAAVELPWLDTERAVLIAVNSIPGDDVAIALDFRPDDGNPCVVASDFWTDPKRVPGGSWPPGSPHSLPASGSREQGPVGCHHHRQRASHLQRVRHLSCSANEGSCADSALTVLSSVMNTPCSVFATFSCQRSDT